jgi:hypothetical protein
MNQIPDMCDEVAYSGTMWLKFGATRQLKLFPTFHTVKDEIDSFEGAENRAWQG